MADFPVILVEYANLMLGKFTSISAAFFELPIEKIRQGGGENLPTLAGRGLRFFPDACRL